MLKFPSRLEGYIWKFLYFVFYRIYQPVRIQNLPTENNPTTNDANRQPNPLDKIKHRKVTNYTVYPNPASADVEAHTRATHTLQHQAIPINPRLAIP